MEICPMVAELFYADSQTDMTNLLTIFTNLQTLLKMCLL